MTDPWTAAGNRWDAFLAARVAGLKERNPGLWAQVGHDSTEFFPLRGWASLSRDGTPNEDLAISLDFLHVAGGVECRADIARGDGEILAETAAVTLDASADPETLRVAVQEAMAAVEAFLRAHQDLFVAELGAEGPGENA